MMKQAVKGFQGFAHGQKVQERGMLKLGADFLPKRCAPRHAFVEDFAGGWRGNIFDHLDGGGLPCTVCPLPFQSKMSSALTPKFAV